MKSKIYVQDLKSEKRLVSNNLTSDLSGSRIEKSGFLIRCFSRTFKNHSFVVSQEELHKIKSHDVSPVFDVSLYDYFEYNIVASVSSIPRGSFLFLDNTPALRDSKAAADVFSAASNQMSGETVKDETRCAGRTRLRQQEGVKSVEERDRVFLEDNRDRSLKELYDSENEFLSEDEMKSSLKQAQIDGLKARERLESEQSGRLEVDSGVREH